MTGALHAFIRLIFPSQKYMALHLLELPQPHSASLPNITPFQLSVANKTFLAVLPDLAVLAVLSAVVRLARIAALSFVRHTHCLSPHSGVWRRAGFGHVGFLALCGNPHIRWRAQMGRAA